MGAPKEGEQGRPRVDVGVVTWNTADLTVKALRHLTGSDQGAELRLLVHDNASGDGTVDALRREVPAAEVEAGTANLGFARAVNRLLARSDAPWFLALNSDAWPEPGAVGALVEAARQLPRAAAVAPLLLRPDGGVEHSTHPFPTTTVALLDAVRGRSWLPRRWLEELCLEGAWAHDRRRTVDWAVGAALLMRRSAVEELGGFDERFFMYVEDLEWCWRARRRGWSILFEPAAVVRHVGNASGAGRFGSRRASLEAANLDRFLRSARGPVAAGAYRAVTAAGLASRMVGARRRQSSEEADHWRLLLRACIGLEEPPPVDLAEIAGEDEHGRDGPDGPEVAVVVATRNRWAGLARLVAALEAQTVPPDRYEVVVVDDGSTDDTPAVLADLASRTPLALRVLRLPARAGAAAARNRGWRATTAPLVAFTDDDCVPDPGWIAAGRDALAAGAGVVVGRTLPPPDQAALGATPFSAVLDVSSERFMETCNVFYRRADLAAVGGFDERFRRPSGEDTELGLRVLGLGRRAEFCPGAVVHHDVRVRGPVAAAREALRWADLPLVVRGRPWARRRLLHRRVWWKASHPPAAAALAGLLLAVRWRAALVLVLPWLDRRLRVDPVTPQWWRRPALLPGALLVDAAEVVTMARGSLRHRTVVL